MKNKIDKQALREKIQSLEGLSNEDKSQLLALLAEQKKYGLVWEDSKEDAEEVLREKIPVLHEVIEKRLDNGGDDAPNHILIEGDNLYALTALTYTHEGKVDVIYIDPPYNTGNKDFVYNDSFVDSEDSYRHSKWLSFMEKRLRIAKKLLSDKGIIFISIDDNEQANLKLLCDEVFGAEKHVASLPRLTKKAGKTTDSIAINHDYVLVYANEHAVFNKFEHNDEAFKLQDEFVDTRGKYKLSQTLDYDTLGYVNSLDYPITINGITYYPGSVTESEYLIRKKMNPKNGSRWRWSEELFKYGFKQGFVVVKKSKNGERLYTKTYQNATIQRKDNCYQIVLTERKRLMPSIELINNEYSNDNARKDLDAIFLEKAFDYPKPLALIKILAFLSTCKQSLILDFFAGSGTTLHATMQLNAEDGGHRQCILVTNNENNICEEVTYERNKRVINGYTTPKGASVEGLKKNNLRYYKTEFVPRDNSLTGKRKLMSSCTDLLCIKNDLYKEETSFGRLKLKPTIARYFNDGKKQMLIIYNVDAIEDIVEEIKQMPEDTKLQVYVFSTTNYAMDTDFEEVSDKVSLCALPAAIYNAYLKVLPKKKELETNEDNEEVEA